MRLVRLGKTHHNFLVLPGDNRSDSVVLPFVKCYIVDIVEATQQVRLYSVRIAGLTKNFEQDRIGHEEEPRKHQALRFQVPDKHT